MNKNKSILILIFILFQNNFIHAQSLKEQIDSLLTDNFFQGTQIGIDIFDLTSKEPLYSKNEKYLLRPASTLKILTTAASLLFLEDYSFSTSIYYTGDVEDSICNADLFLVGGLDPDFTSTDLDSLVREIKNHGINEIQGNLYADISIMDSLFWGEGWMWDDDPYPFAAYLSALNINDNSIKVIYEPGVIGKPVLIKLSPETKYVEVRNQSVTFEGDSSSLKINRDWINRKNVITVDGFVPANQKIDTVTLNIFDPAKYFTTLFLESLNKHGIKNKKKFEFKNLEEDSEEIITVERNIDSVIINTNKNSDNLSAEMLLRALGNEYYGKPSSAAKGKILIDSLIEIAGFNPQNFRIADGSGLSFYNLVTPQLLNGILKYFYYEEPELFVKLYNSFPISGFDGSLQKRMINSNSFRKVRAKTGTLSGVSNLSGYMTNKNNHVIAFTIMIQNYVGSAQTARAVQDRISEIIYNYDIEIAK
ncbi:MAG: D-alanyl-D-alanine carboxypeptidase/D-alanyl-D-alanine-endopeptidase [Bacteroidota bacterium]